MFQSLMYKDLGNSGLHIEVDQTQEFLQDSHQTNSPLTYSKELRITQQNHRIIISWQSAVQFMFFLSNIEQIKHCIQPSPQKSWSHPRWIHDKNIQQLRSAVLWNPARTSSASPARLASNIWQIRPVANSFVTWTSRRGKDWATECRGVRNQCGDIWESEINPSKNPP